jgi:hypothetical protein
MIRREFITLLGGAAVTWPVASRAQQPERMRRIGFLGPRLDVLSISAQYQAFLARLRELGFSEGKIPLSNIDAMMMLVGRLPLWPK